MDPGAKLTFPVQATGGHPLTFELFHNGSLLSTSGGTAFTINDVLTPNTGNYQLVVTNNYGAVTGAVASVRIYSGPLSSNLVVHLTFDGNFSDSSGRGNNATYVPYGASASPTARFAPGMFGQAFEYTTTTDWSDIEYATLGYPADLQFGATNDFSVSMWVNYTNQNDDLPFISNKDWSSSDDLGWGIFTQTGGNYRINVTGQNGSADKFSFTDTPSTLKNGNWHNLVVSFQRAPFGQTAYVYGYLDGILVTKHPMNVVALSD